MNKKYKNLSKIIKVFSRRRPEARSFRLRKTTHKAKLKNFLLSRTEFFPFFHINDKYDKTFFYILKLFLKYHTLYSNNNFQQGRDLTNALYRPVNLSKNFVNRFNNNFVRHFFKHKGLLSSELKIFPKLNLLSEVPVNTQRFSVTNYKKYFGCDSLDQRTSKDFNIYSSSILAGSSYGSGPLSILENFVENSVTLMLESKKDPRILYVFSEDSLHNRGQSLQPTTFNGVLKEPKYNRNQTNIPFSKLIGQHKKNQEVYDISIADNLIKQTRYNHINYYLDSFFSSNFTLIPRQIRTPFLLIRGSHYSFRAANYLLSAEFIVHEIKKWIEQKKSTKRILSQVIKDFKRQFRNPSQTSQTSETSTCVRQPFFVSGIRIALTGCLGRKGSKAKTLWRQAGRLETHVFDQLMDFSIGSASTRLGQIGIRVLICIRR